MSDIVIPGITGKLRALSKFHSREWRTPKFLLALTLAALAAVPPNSKAEDGKWAFVPPRDEFSSHSMLDLRYLNETVAGESGYVTLSKDRNDLVLGNGKPARF